MNKLCISLFLILKFIYFSSMSIADNLNAQVVDVGAGLCVPIKIEGEEQTYQLLYGAGGQNDGTNICKNAVDTFFKDSDKIDLMIISHGDDDHLYDADEIIENYEVKELIRIGFDSGTSAWDKFNQAINNQGLERDTTVCRSNQNKIIERKFLKAKVILATRNCTKAGDNKDRDSIMARIELGDYSMMLTGDAEEETIISSRDLSFDTIADIIIAPQQGSENAALPKYFVSDRVDQAQDQLVVFSSGNKHEYPRAIVASGYQRLGILSKNMFRTDLGGLPEGEKEWKFCTQNIGEDPIGDDSISITWTDQGYRVDVMYVSESIPYHCAVEGFPTILDGNTLGLGGKRISLYGIDAPEKDQKCKDERDKQYNCGEEAIEALKMEISGHHIECFQVPEVRAELIPYVRDYDMIATCYFTDEAGDSINLNKRIVEKGWAIAVRRNYQDQFEPMPPHYVPWASDYTYYERTAQANQAGIWAGYFIPPVEWKRGQRF